MLGRDRELLFDLLEDSKREALKEDEGTTTIFTSYGPEWRPFGQPRNRRPLDSVILAEGKAQRILNDVKEFLGILLLLCLVLMLVLMQAMHNGTSGAVSLIVVDICCMDRQEAVRDTRTRKIPPLTLRER